MSIFITGADGFIGGYLSNFFKESKISHVPLTLEKVDLTSYKQLIDFCESEDIVPSIIIHCATAVRDKNLKYEDQSLANNIMMFNNIMELAEKHNAYVINLGSGSDVDRKFWDKDMDEYTFLEHPPLDADIHGLSKNIISKLINESKYGKILNLRLFGVFGIGEDYSAKLIPNTIAKCLLNIPITLISDRYYDYIDVRDLARFLADMELKIKGHQHIIQDILSMDRDINFCSGKLTSIYQIVTYISEQISPGYPISLQNDVLGKSYGGSTNRFRKHFPEFNFSDIYDSIDVVIEYYRKKSKAFSKEILRKDSFLNHAKNINV